ncbi:FGGY family carbohydrate kinase [Isoptericola sp. NPDC056618]|uniref:FGGY family carbohydrate kinase n=1 Tax=Isoptericola sp. NPDC056618 TaxID=3345878 RepID=UPI0036CC5B0B
MTTRTVLGIDVGTTNTKAVLVDPAEPGHAIAACSAPTPVDAASLVDTVVDLVRQVRGAGGPPPPAAVGITSMAETGALLVDDVPVGPLLRWQAGSTTAFDGDPSLYAATGVPHPRKTPVAMLQALRAAGDPRLMSGRTSGRTRWAGAAELVGHALTGRLATHPTLAARTLAYRRPAPGGALPEAFDPDLLALCGLRPEDFPEVLRSAEPLGRTGTPLTALLPAGTPVVLAGHDHAVASWAVGVRAPGDVADSLGTTEAMYALAEGAPEVAAARLAGVSLAPDLSGKRTSVLGASATAGAVLEWFARERQVDLDALDPLALAGLRDRASDVVHPYLRGRQCPLPDPDIRPGALPVDDAVALGAVARGLALQARWMLETVGDLAGPTAVPVVIPGPLQRCGTWQAARDGLLGTVVRSAAFPEVAAAGAALRAAALVDLAPSDATLPVSAPGPDRSWPDAHETYTRFLATARNHQPRKQDSR